jgi:dTMP kinase
MIVDLSFRLPVAPTFLAFEGINGCGKSTLLSRIQARLSARGEKVVSTREPGGTALGVELRRLLLDWKGEKKSDRAELLLFAADRAEHVEKVIRPGLASGSWVLSDRFIHSTIAFQCHGRGLRRDWTEEANALAIQNTRPSLVILLDLDPVVAAERLRKRGDAARDAFEEEAMSFHRRIREGFLECARSESTPFLVLDATQTPAELEQQAAAVLGLDA